MQSYFERYFLDLQHHFREQVRNLGNYWLQETEAGIAWSQRIAESEQRGGVGARAVTVDRPTAPDHILRWNEQNGLEFTLHHAVDFYKKILIAVETDNIEAGTIGWLAMDDDQFWLNNLTNVALELILLYVQAEGLHMFYMLFCPYR
jgi:hypothetical protein